MAKVTVTENLVTVDTTSTVVSVDANVAVGAKGETGVITATAPATYDSATRTIGVTTGTTSGTTAAGNDSRITGAAQKASNLADLSSQSTARTNLGLGTIATLPATTTNSGTAISSTNKIVDQTTNTSAIPVVSIIAGQWLQGYHNTGTPATLHGHATECCMPIRVQTRMTFDQISVYVPTAGSVGSVIRFGLRADSAGLPGTLISDYGTFSSVVTSTWVGPTGLSVTLEPYTTYWLSFTPQTTAQNATPPATRATIQYANQAWLTVPAMSLATQATYGWRSSTAIGTTGTVTGALQTNFATPLISTNQMPLSESIAFALRSA